MEAITLYKKGKFENQVLIWSIIVKQLSNGHADICRSSGIIGGKITEKSTVIKVGNNIGKSNEKSAYELAIFKSKKFIKDKVEDNWHYSIDDIDKPIEYIKPMLAEPYTADKLVLPCWVQPKLNGVRCFSLRHENDTRMLSRQRKEFSALVEIRKGVDTYFGKYSPDGEGYNHDMPFEHITSAVKKRSEDTAKLKLWVYDLAIPDYTFNERIKIIAAIFEEHAANGINDYFVQVPSHYITTVEEIKYWHDYYVGLGYEGLIIRLPDGLYEFNERTFSLMKLKEFVDEEFKLIGYTIEVWHDSLNDQYLDLIVWQCETEDGNVFDVRPKGSFISRHIALATAQDQLGKPYTVKFQNYSELGVPIFPVGIGVRDYESKLDE